MTSDYHARMLVAALIFMMVNAVVFGVGLVAVLTTPAMAQQAFFWIPAVVVSRFVFSAPLAWFVAPMMMQRFTRRARFVDPLKCNRASGWLKAVYLPGRQEVWLG